MCTVAMKGVEAAERGLCLRWATGAADPKSERLSVRSAVAGQRGLG